MVIFNENLVKVAESYLKKGSTVYIEGALQTRKWTDQQGVEKYSTEIVLQKFRGELTMLGGRPGGGDAGMDDGGYSAPARPQRERRPAQRQFRAEGELRPG